MFAEPRQFRAHGIVFASPTQKPLVEASQFLIDTPPNKKQAATETHEFADPLAVARQAFPVRVEIPIAAANGL
jgi:hypothetical protein